MCTSLIPTLASLKAKEYLFVCVLGRTEDPKLRLRKLVVSIMHTNRDFMRGGGGRAEFRFALSC